MGLPLLPGGFVSRRFCRRPYNKNCPADKTAGDCPIFRSPGEQNRDCPSARRFWQQAVLSKQYNKNCPADRGGKQFPGSGAARANHQRTAATPAAGKPAGGPHGTLGTSLAAGRRIASEPIQVAVSGPAGRVAYGLLFRIAAGDMFGPPATGFAAFARRRPRARTNSKPRGWNCTTADFHCSASCVSAPPRKKCSPTRIGSSCSPARASAAGSIATRTRPRQRSALCRARPGRQSRGGGPPGAGRGGALQYELPGRPAKAMPTCRPSTGSP